MNSKKEKSELYMLRRKFDLELAGIDVVNKFGFRLNLILRKLACTAYCYIFFIGSEMQLIQSKPREELSLDFRGSKDFGKDDILGH